MNFFIFIKSYMLTGSHNNRGIIKTEVLHKRHSRAILLSSYVIQES